jgi:hypothetical protein
MGGARSMNGELEMHPDSKDMYTPILGKHSL